MVSGAVVVASDTIVVVPGAVVVSGNVVVVVVKQPSSICPSQLLSIPSHISGDGLLQVRQVLVVGLQYGVGFEQSEFVMHCTQTSGDTVV